MAQLIAILIAALLFFGFILITMYEERRGSRFFARARYRLDTNVSRAQFLIEHIDWGAFTAHLTRTSLNTIAHDAAAGTLTLVRTAERNLTKAVHALSARRDAILPAGRSIQIRSKSKPMGDIVRKEEDN